MRDLLGGKGANVAEMTRVLGADRVPAGFTITTEACVAYMKAGQDEPDGMAEQVADALERLQEHTGKQLGDDEDPLLVSVRSGARESMPGMLDTVLNLGLNDTSVEGLAKRHRQRALRVGLLPALRADVRQRQPRHRRRGVREGDLERQGRRRRRGGHRARRQGAQGPGRPLQGALQGRDGRRVPAGPAGAAAPVDPRRLRLLDRRPREVLPPDQPHPRRLGHRGQRPADGLRQQGRHVGLRRRLQPRRGDRRARAQRRLPAQRPGRGRRLRRAHAARHRRDEGLAARRLRAADGHPRARSRSTTATCRTPSSRWRRGSSTCSRRATPSGRPRPPCASRATPSRKGCSSATRR